jgi:hypothetical protein
MPLTTPRAHRVVVFVALSAIFVALPAICPSPSMVPGRTGYELSLEPPLILDNFSRLLQALLRRYAARNLPAYSEVLLQEVYIISGCISSITGELAKPTSSYKSDCSVNKRIELTMQPENNTSLSTPSSGYVAF